ncbi:MAG: homoserine dehydrogenase [Pseudomonadota bacterium]
MTTDLKPIKIGLLGLGTVGGGTIAVLTRNADIIARRAGRRIEIAAATARDVTKPRPFPTDQLDLMTDGGELVQRDDINIVVELIGGVDEAYHLVRSALENGKHVVTANKALIALKGNELFELAQRHGLIVAFESAVAGGIPVIKTTREALAGNQVQWLAGIINGTCNFILSAMYQRGADFADVLKEAQALGYAEADPSFDVDGVDAAHKLTILASIAFGIPLQFEKTFIEGIRDVSAIDIDYASRLGYRVKHLGIARQRDAGIELRVHPTLVPDNQLLANVEEAMNAVMIQGDAVGQTLYYGAGAGAEPTASAVVADIVDVTRALTVDPESHVPHLAFQPGKLANLPILEMSEVETAYYLRLSARDKPGVLADVTQILGANEISIEAINQQEPAAQENWVSVVILTHRVNERAMNEAISHIEGLEDIREPVVRIRMESLS